MKFGTQRHYLELDDSLVTKNMIFKIQDGL